MGDIIPFEPTDVDVISTKKRSMNTKHPGNIFYTQLVQNVVSKIPVTDDLRHSAETIVGIIIDERGGRFLKPPDGEIDPTCCIAMDRKQAIAKVLHALKTAYSKQGKMISSHDGLGTGKGVGDIGTTTTTKSSSSKSVPAHGEKKTPSPVPRSKGTKRNDRLEYRIQPSDTTPIPQFTRLLIEAVCNQTVPQTAHHILDQPLHNTSSGVGAGGMMSSPQSESDEERVHRLHLRLRFAGAVAVDMAPLEFASKLLRLWNAKLVLVKKKESPKSKGTGTEEIRVATTATTTTTTVGDLGSAETTAKEEEVPTTTTTTGIPAIMPPCSDSIPSSTAQMMSTPLLTIAPLHATDLMDVSGSSAPELDVVPVPAVETDIVPVPPADMDFVAVSAADPPGRHEFRFSRPG